MTSIFPPWFESWLHLAIGAPHRRGLKRSAARDDRTATIERSHTGRNRRQTSRRLSARNSVVTGIFDSLWRRFRGKQFAGSRYTGLACRTREQAERVRRIANRLRKNPRTIAVS